MTDEEIGRLVDLESDVVQWQNELALASARLCKFTQDMILKYQYSERKESE